MILVNMQFSFGPTLSEAKARHVRAILVAILASRNFLRKWPRRRRRQLVGMNYSRRYTLHIMCGIGQNKND